MTSKHKTNSFLLFEQERQHGNPRVATLAKHLIEIRKKNIAASLSDFEGSAHKLEYVKTLSGVDFINDSRSTNITSVWYSIINMTKPTTWIMNIDNMEPLTEDLRQAVREKVKCVVIQGVYNTEIYEYFASLGVKVLVEMNLEDAVRVAFYASSPGDVILFSPGVTGNAQFTYRERGDKFKGAVGQL